MTLSVHLEPDLQARVEQETRRLGVSKSEFVKDALERTLGIRNSADLLDKVRTENPTMDSNISVSVSSQMKSK